MAKRLTDVGHAKPKIQLVFVSHASICLIIKVTIFRNTLQMGMDHVTAVILSFGTKKAVVRHMAVQNSNLHQKLPKVRSYVLVAMVRLN